METTQALSRLLQRLQDEKVISPAIAERLNSLESETLQLQAVKELPEAFNLAADQLVNRLSGKPVQVLYENPQAPLKTRIWEDLAKAAGDTLATDAIPGGWGELGAVLRRWIRQAWQWGKTSSILKGAVALWLLSLIWSGVVNRMSQRANPEPIDVGPVYTPTVQTSPVAVTATRRLGDTVTRRTAGLQTPPAPKNLRWVRTSTGGVRLLWDAPPPTGLRYNVYVSFAGDPSSWDVGNDPPLEGPEIVWTPPAQGVQVFEIYLKAVDSKGRESAPSNHIIADLR